MRVALGVIGLVTLFGGGLYSLIWFAMQPEPQNPTFSKFVNEHHCELLADFGKDVKLGNANGAFTDVTPYVKRLYSCGAYMILED